MASEAKLEGDSIPKFIGKCFTKQPLAHIKHTEALTSEASVSLWSPSKKKRKFQSKISIGAGQIYMKAGPCWNLAKFVRVCKRAE